MIFRRIRPNSLGESEAESSYQELWKEQKSNDLKQLTGELTSDRDSSNAVRGGNGTLEDLLWHLRFHVREPYSIDQHW